MIWAALQLTAGTGGAPYIELPIDPPFFGPDARDFMLTEPIHTGPRGLIELGNRPGLGFDIDEAKLLATVA
jgi:L-alanine-DL-glutamate epimerase-like enolase superfamily enzyme